MRSAWTTKYKPGDTFNDLTLQTLHVIGSKRFWECVCVCKGVTKPLREYHIVNSKVKSCGCLQNRNRGEKHHNYTGCGGLGGAYYAMMKYQAGLRKIEFSLSVEYLWNLFLEQGRKCALTGVDLNITSQHYREIHQEEQFASLDRIDSEKPYVEGNVWWVHKDVNRMKREYTVERFLEVCRQVARLHPG